MRNRRLDKSKLVRSRRVDAPSREVAHLIVVHAAEAVSMVRLLVELLGARLVERPAL